MTTGKGNPQACVVFYNLCVVPGNQIHHRTWRIQIRETRKQRISVVWTRIVYVRISWFIKFLYFWNYYYPDLRKIFLSLNI